MTLEAFEISFVEHLHNEGNLELTHLHHQSHPSQNMEQVVLFGHNCHTSPFLSSVLESIKTEKKVLCNVSSFGAINPYRQEYNKVVNTL